MALITPSRANGSLFGPVGPSVSWAWITDTHHDPIKATDPNQGGKYFQDAFEKITDISAALNARNDISFVFQNGDFIDGSADAATALVDLADINNALDVNVPKYHNLGNHEVTQLTKEQVMAVTNQPSKYYSFQAPTRNEDGSLAGYVTFIALDGNYLSDDDNDDLSVSSGQGGVSPYVSYIPPTQLAWLESTIAASQYPCVIFCHYPVYYSGAFSWGLTNAAAVRAVLEAASDKVIGCVSGHLHENYVKRVNGILYATTHATTAAAYPSLNYSIITAYPGNAKTLKLISYGVMGSHIEAT